MVTIADLPDHALEIVFSNLNQHQTVALAPLHSKLYLLAKSKLYYYIFVYDIEAEKANGVFIIPGNEACALPDFRFPRYLNNRTTNKCTIVSVKTVSKYLKQMDPNQPLLHLVFQHTHVSLFDKIIKHFKSIKYFIIYECETAEFYTKCNTKFRAFDSLSRKPFITRTLTHIGDTDPYTHESSSVTCKAENDLFMSSLEFDDENNRIEIDILRPLSMRKMHLVLGLCRPKLKITQNFNTQHLRELFITGIRGLDDAFTDLQLDNDYPNLVLLGWCKRERLYFGERDDEMTHLSHRLVRNVIIATYAANDKVAREICALTTQFPKASINWWSSLHSMPKRLIIEQLYMYSPVMAVGFVGFHWAPSCLNYSNTIQESYVVGKEGNETSVELVRYYTGNELSQLVLLYCGTNCMRHY